MPVCVISTNMKRSEMDADLEKTMAKCIAETTDNALEVVFVMVHAELPAFYGGSTEPAVICKISSMKNLNDKEKFEELYAKYFEILKNATKIPGNRIVVELAPVEPGFAQIGK